MNGETLRRARVAAGVSYPKLAAAMGTALSRVPAIERAERVSDPVARRYIAGLCAISQSQGAQGAIDRLTRAVLEESVLAGTAQ